MIRRITTPAALAAATALLVAACGSSATPSPSTAGATAPASSAAASQAPGGSGTTGGQTGATVFGGAADKLDTLTSYKFSVEIQTVTATPSPQPTTLTQTTSMSGTVINSPTKAYSLQMTTGGQTTGIILIGADAWLKQGTGYQQVPAAMAETFVQTMGAYRPEKIFTLAFGASGDRFTKVGDESRNGVACSHFKGDTSLSSVYSTMFGVAATFSSDVWIARDGGYVVSSEIKTTGANAAGGGSYSSVVNITDINSSTNKVDKPS